MFIVQPLLRLYISAKQPGESFTVLLPFEQVVGGRGLVSCESDMDVEGTSQQKTDP